MWCDNEPFLRVDSEYHKHGLTLLKTPIGRGIETSSKVKRLGCSEIGSGIVRQNTQVERLGYAKTCRNHAVTVFGSADCTRDNGRAFSAFNRCRSTWGVLLYFIPRVVGGRCRSCTPSRRPSRTGQRGRRVGCSKVDFAYIQP